MGCLEGETFGTKDIVGPHCELPAYAVIRRELQSKKNLGKVHIEARAESYPRMGGGAG